MKLEILEKGGYYHLYNKGINGTNIFNNEANKIYFLNQLQKYLNGKISIYAYCLMDNHFHFVVKIDDLEKVATQALSNFFNSYAKAFNKQNERTGSLFEKHFKRIKIENEKYLRDLIVYIHLNPYLHYGVDYRSYRFSSFISLISKKETKLKREDVLELFGDVENFIFCHEKKNEYLNEKYTFE